jgi:hypothetical protein
VEEARRVLERLDRVEELHLRGAPAAVLLDELRMLVAEAERWLAAEPVGAEGAAPSVERCREALAAAMSSTRSTT